MSDDSKFWLLFWAMALSFVLLFSMLIAISFHVKDRTLLESEKACISSGFNWGPSYGPSIVSQGSVVMSCSKP